MSVRNRIGNANSYVKQRLGTKPNYFEEDISPSSGMTSQDDARFRLIQKKREKITDARERLTEIAKTQDARKKLNKIRVQNGSSVGKEKVPNIIKTSVGSFGNQLRNRPVSKLHTASSKVVSLDSLTFDSESKASFIGMKKPLVFQGKTQMKSGSITRTVNSGISSNLVVKKPVTLNKASSDRYHPLPNNPNVVTIRNDNVGKTIDKGNQRLGSLPQLKAKRVLQKTPTHLINSSRAGVSRQSGSSRNGMQQFVKTIKGNSSYSPFQSSSSQSFTQEIRPARLKITTTNNYVDYDAPVENDRYRVPPSPVTNLKRNSYDDYEQFYQPPPKKQTLSNSIVSRLDQSQQISSGYKVIVTNLHHVVTGEDIEELFGNIGPIKYARLIREGIAEVLFHEKGDAYRSVEVYHNRQLDGQAMSVTVVSKSNEMSMSSNPYNRYSPASRPSYSPPRPSYSAPSRPNYSPPPRPNYSPPRPFPPPQSRRTGHTMTASQPSSRPKSVLRTAGGCDYGDHTTAMSVLSSNKRMQKLNVAPDIHAIHHALFSGKSSGGSHGGRSDPQVVIKLPKGPLRGSK